MSDSPFHLAFPVDDLASTRDFYGRVLGCRIGRSAEHWVDFELFGHQLTAHLRDGAVIGDATVNQVDGDAVPVPHFGVVLGRDAWDALVARVREAGVQFLIGPRVRFEGQPGEQGTFFVRDPSGNALEFKTFSNATELFT